MFSGVKEINAALGVQGPPDIENPEETPDMKYEEDEVKMDCE